MHIKFIFSQKVRQMIAATLGVLSHESPVKCDVISYTTCSPAAVNRTDVTPGG